MVQIDRRACPLCLVEYHLAHHDPTELFRSVEFEPLLSEVMTGDLLGPPRCWASTRRARASLLGLCDTPWRPLATRAQTNTIWESSSKFLENSAKELHIIQKA
ncbi:hypothetical protein [Rhizobium leucaenae]|uniref:Uncharacterized protein n=1 Tax=Rhizobium leucaenae TaxID=29450 RepID=A0A7W6ZQN1_9HYPH|nr:hypothetical protein [Rhizobium leucaenae]MBB4566936.1 hypothetical protein [Rhizobium leucaenae]MBB6300745.1 hypothetical protein [Rhizobium leucaenae]